MKRLNTFVILIAVLFLFGCAGGNAAKKKPEHIISGMKEIKKGNTWYQKGCYKRSLEYFFRAHELFAASDQLDGVAMSMNNVGNIYRIMEDIDSSLLFFEESISIYQDTRNYTGLIQALSNKAAVLIDSDRLEEAAGVLKSAEDIAQKNSISTNHLLNKWGILFIRQKEYSRAEKILNSALANTDPADHSEYATVNFALGTLMRETGRYEKAVYFFKAALDTDRLSGFHKGIADDLSAIGDIHFSQGKYEPAVNYFKRSIKIYALIENRKKVSEVMDRLVKAAKKAGLDISITKHFVKNWLEEKAFENPCK
ncbi:MAG: tetratricopeptide repeat protein [Desulfobacterales bacterium]|uniref:Tetratricopeptide repeat protein n=1 Tax=Candidatus Desulfaltia bathyphila TaxID=2841697 RepID=A0A8J6TCC3_9BACT|nr:tetratricopeptide repeat protein [Candidatus Desulfaltia bathyphila]MBL7208047.1 tetratricopeptide repeat protein [Desulfobacterales bacterium]